MLEVELKVFAGEDVKGTLSRIKALGWEAAGVSQQSDTYYTSKHKDFIASEECLRIRVSETRSELTWKPPTSDAMRKARQYWKEEVDLDLEGQVDLMRTLLSRLEFDEYVTVEKHRTIFRVDDQSMVCVDHIAGLGWFVEVETFAETPEGAIERNIALLKDLKLDDAKRINMPYRDLVKAAEDGGGMSVLAGANESTR